MADQYDVTEGQCPEDCPDVEVATYCINELQQVQNISRVNVKKYCPEDCPCDGEYNSEGCTLCGKCDGHPGFDLPKTFCVADTQPAQNVARVNVNKTNVGVQSTKDILYADLLALINNNELIPGSSYRITDYTTTTVQTNTTSAGHYFDIIVTALSNNELSENAKCVSKAGDTYFANAKLESWEIKYRINNDTSRFAWADAVNGKGVIYYMKDEWGNECPYDFKNIQFNKLSVFLYTFGGTADDSLTGGCHHNTIIDYTSSSVLTLNSNTFGNSCFSNKFGTGCYGNTFGTGCKYNTFDDDCNNNTFGDSCFSNTFGDSCFSNTFGNNYGNNTFGNSCFSNKFGIGCKNNTLGDYCSSNMFGTSCLSNTFGSSCSSNTFGNNYNSNTFGNNCLSNTFGNNCFSNTFGNHCSSNELGDGCGSNTFGNSFQSNKFGNGCYYNTFGSDCCHNNFYVGNSVDAGTTKKDYIKYLILEDGCRYNNFYSSIITNTDNYLQRIRIKGLEYTTPTNIQITLPTTNTKYEWLICRMSDGTLKQYCPDEEINKLLPLIYAGL